MELQWLIQEVLGDDGDFGICLCRMVSIGRPESQGNGVDTVGGAVLVDDRNGPETKKKIKHLRIHFSYADQKKRRK